MLSELKEIKLKSRTTVGNCVQYDMISDVSKEN